MKLPNMSRICWACRTDKMSPVGIQAPVVQQLDLFGTMHGCFLAVDLNPMWNNRGSRLLLQQTALLNSPISEAFGTIPLE
jgi:hypothetical protein